MLGSGENSFAPFILASSQSVIASGQVATLPLFVGALLQNIAPWGLQKLGSVRTWSVAMATLQGLSLVALALASSFLELPLWASFALISLYWAAGWSVGPAWNTWMDSLVPQRIRARFFSRRNGRCWLVQWLTMLAVSGVLWLAQKAQVTLPVFASLFALTGCARLVSAYCMARQSEPVPLPSDYRVLGFAEVSQLLFGKPSARPLLYMLGAQLSLSLASPFLVPFWVQQKHFSYGAVMLCLSAAILSRALWLPRLGEVARKFGPHKLFRWSGWGLALVPLLWLLPSSSLAFALCVQIFTGSCLAAYELAVTLVYLEAIPAGTRTSILTRFSVFNTLSMLLGSSLGATFLWFTSSYLGLFAIAASARLMALRLLRSQAKPLGKKKPREVRDAKLDFVERVRRSRSLRRRTLGHPRGVKSILR